MCIAAVSTAHPDYPLILIDNRDEFIGRPTAPAAFWPAPYEHVLGGWDLHRAENGTWLGLTTDGRIAVLTNIHQAAPAPTAARSRGAVVRAFLDPSLRASEAGRQPPSTEAFVREVVHSEAMQEAGPFSLICGRVGERLAVASNRGPKTIAWIERDRTVALSNGAFGGAGWPKVDSAQKLLENAVVESLAKGWSKDQLTGVLFDILSTDSLPDPGVEAPRETWIQRVRETIFVPLLGEKGPVRTASTETQPATPGSGLYGTQKQTVVLVDRQGHATFTEKTLFDEQGIDLSEHEQSTRAYEFALEGQSIPKE